MRIIFETDPEEKKEDPGKETQGGGPQKGWNFEGIRQTLWGEGQVRSDVWDFSGIRETLWGK